MTQVTQGRKLDLEQARIDQATDLALVDVNKINQEPPFLLSEGGE